VRVIVWITVGLLILGIFQYIETFGTGTRFLRSSQLRIMNNDRDPFNQPLLFHTWSTQNGALLDQGLLPPRRVVLIVLDGMRWDAVDKNPDFRHLVRESQLSKNMFVS
jgi:hypothetical protein